MRFALENHRLVAELRQLRRATHPGRSAADDGDTFARFFRGRFQDRDAVFVNMIGRVTLEPADFDRVAVAIEHDAGAFAEHLGRANPRAARAKDVGGENGAGRAGHIPGHDLFDEGRDIDAGRAGGDAGRVEAEKAAGRFHDRLLLGVARGDVAQVGGELVGGEFWAQRHLQDGEENIFAPAKQEFQSRRPSSRQAQPRLVDTPLPPDTLGR